MLISGRGGQPRSARDRVQACRDTVSGTSGLRFHIAPTVPVALGLLLAGCSSFPSSMNPVSWWHDLQGGKIAEERPPPPGADQPYPNLATVPPKPAEPDRAALANIANGLIADRTNTQRANEAAPIADPSLPSASPALFGKGTVPPPPPPGPPGTETASASLPAADAPPAPPSPAPSSPAPSAPSPARRARAGQAPVAAVQSAALPPPAAAVPPAADATPTAPATPAPAAWHARGQRAAGATWCLRTAHGRGGSIAAIAHHAATAAEPREQRTASGATGGHRRSRAASRAASRQCGQRGERDVRRRLGRAASNSCQHVESTGFAARKRHHRGHRLWRCIVERPGCPVGGAHARTVACPGDGRGAGISRRPAFGRAGGR